MSELIFPANNSNKTPSFPQSLARPIGSQKTEAYALTASDLEDNGGGDDPQFLHYNSTYNTDSPKCTPYIQGKNLPMNCYPQKECHLLRNLNFPNTVPRKIGDRTTPNLIVIGPNVKLAIPIEMPIGNITPNTPRNPRLNELKEREGSL